MEILLYVLLGLIVAALLFAGALIFSVRRQGKLAQRLLTRFLHTKKGQEVAAKSMDKLLSNDEGKIDPENLRTVLDQQPELIDRMAQENNIDPKKARAALSQFSGMSSEQQKQMISQVQGATAAGMTNPQTIAATINTSSTDAASERAKAKKKEAARRKRKQAKQQKRR